MALKPSDYTRIRAALEASSNPLIFFHDDADGLSSFLLLRRFMGRGTGIMVKPVPVVDASYLHHVERHKPDRIFIVDIATVEQDFLDGTGVPVIWIDHHQPLRRRNVQYFNPRVSNINDKEPATYLCFRAVRQDLWIAMTGIVGDWHLTEVANDFSRHYPDLLASDVTRPEDALFASKTGRLVRIFSLILKGPEAKAYANIELLLGIQSPYELLNCTSPAAKTLSSYYKPYQEKYDALLKKALSTHAQGNFFVFTYAAQDSFTSELSNELLYRHPDKVIILAREKNGEMRMSLRGSGDNVILPRLQKALAAVQGSGGGHEHACGACVKKKHFARFLELFKAQF